MKAVTFIFVVMIVIGAAVLWGYKSMLEPHDRPVGRRQSIGFERARAALQPEDKQAFTAKRAFAARLAKAAELGKSGSNGAISPFGADMCLALLLNGAQGDSFDSCAKAMGLNDPNIERLNGANSRLLDLLASLPDEPLTWGTSMWNVLPVRFNKQYQEDMARLYSADVRKLGSARQGGTDIVNDWVNQATNGQFKSLFTRLDPQAVAMLLSTIVIDVPWGIVSSPTVTGTFRTAKGTRTVPMMKVKSANVQMLAGKDFTIVGLPSKNGTLRCWFVTGAPGQSADSLFGLLDLNWWAKTPESMEQEAVVAFPRFTLRIRQDLQGPLSRLGAGRLFNGPNDFSPMSHDMQPSYKVSNVFQALQVSFKEQSPAPASEVKPGEPPMEHTIDQPFLFVIEETTTGTVLLVGAVNDPSQP
ncbi:MAG: hypothetical protein JSS66_03710 [Armatimonadetes bacterium]|nr:hypothetical protein [Armatimonadota bacterium]